MPASKPRFKAPPGVKITNEDVFAADLTVYPEAQRMYLPGHAARLKREWDPLMVGTIEVSRRPDGTMHVMDGFHRYTVAMDLDPAAVLRAEVYEGLTPEQEALKFLAANKGRRPVHQFDIWAVECTAGVQEALDMKAGTEAAGVRLGYTASTNHIGAIQSVRAAARAGGPELVTDTINVLTAAFGRTAASWDSMLFRGVSLVIHRNRSNIDLARLAHVLTKGTPAGWKAETASALVGGGGSASRSLALIPIICRKYNAGLRRADRRIN